VHELLVEPPSPYRPAGQAVQRPLADDPPALSPRLNFPGGHWWHVLTKPRVTASIPALHSGALCCATWGFGVEETPPFLGAAPCVHFQPLELVDFTCGTLWALAAATVFAAADDADARVEWGGCLQVLDLGPLDVSSGQVVQLALPAWLNLPDGQTPAQLMCMPAEAP
jgi:hypothetical protein